MTFDENKYDNVLACGVLKDEKLFPDNLTDKCMECGCDVEFRPYSPHDERTFLACGPCVMREMGKMIENGEPLPKPVISKRTAAEFYEKTGVVIPHTEGE